MRYAISASAMIPTMMFSIGVGQTFSQPVMKMIIRVLAYKGGKNKGQAFF